MAFECSPVKRSRMEENLNLDDARFDDCWTYVFKRLPFKKRVILERVSQKWKNLMPYTDIHTLQLGKLSWPESRRMEKEYKIEEVSMAVKLVPDDDLRHVLKSALDRFGPYLQQLDFKLENMNERKPIFRLSKDLIDFVVERTPKLVKLHLTCCLLTLGCVPALLNIGKLENLCLGLVTIIEEDLSATMEDLENVKKVVGSTIQNLTTLKKLGLWLEMPVAPPVRNPNLTELYVNGSEMKGQDVWVIIQHCPNLEVLAIEMDAPGFHWTKLGQLHNLRKLSLTFFWFSSQDLVAISEGCPNMESLHLSSPMQMDSWADLCRMRKLKSLSLSPSWDSAVVTDSVLASVTSYGLLESLSLPSAQLTNGALKDLVENCPNLVWLEFRGVKGISDEGVKVVLEKCQQLEMLSVADTGIGDPTLTAIGVKGSSRLKEVHLEKTRVTGD